VIAIDPVTAAVSVVAENVVPNDMAMGADGFLYITETQAQQITRIHLKTGQATPVDTGIAMPNGIALSNDGGTLAVSEYGGEFTWTYRVNADGSLDAKMPTMPMRLLIDQKGEFRMSEPPPYVKASRGDGMAVDRAGRFYVTSAAGVQIFDPTGRPCGVLPVVDGTQPLTTCILAGPNHSALYVANGTKIYRRKLTIQ
jgi:enterochelin esterase family protein